MLAPGAMPMPPTCAASAPEVVAVEVDRSGDAVLGRAQQDSQQEGRVVLDADVMVAAFQSDPGASRQLLLDACRPER